MERERRCWGQAPANTRGRLLLICLAVLVLEVSYAQQQQDHYKVVAPRCTLWRLVHVRACVRALVFACAARLARDSRGAPRAHRTPQILGVKKDAKDREIKKAYHKLALKHHPDKSPECKKSQDSSQCKRANRVFMKISRAYETLSDPEKRRYYDQVLRANAPCSCACTALSLRRARSVCARACACVRGDHSLLRRPASTIPSRRSSNRTSSGGAVATPSAGATPLGEAGRDPMAHGPR
jgi:hypothetical protein